MNKYKIRTIIKQILKDNLISNYDLGNIENGGIGGADETINEIEKFISINFKIDND